MAWIYLIAGGFLEIAWAFGLQESHGFTRLVPSILTVVALISSFALFARAMRVIEIGTAYAIFTGIGTAGTALVGILFLDEPAEVGKLIFITILISGIIGLKVISGEKKPAEQQQTGDGTVAGKDHHSNGAAVASERQEVQ
ncbi:quaternary ammonium compound-resistance protein SugE [Paenibacillus cellulosilyticus]|uniref:Quaternary ammonium compound-resistance protein SugE n=1 Tax=Paenibacillus cellulosilyticus TaxID=375489 RepID=A0A2V2Z3R0_9BACL|nr:quaternary ammonium compound-resistance protein SugE [Paenibacillus cellulosilyticus]QKS48037.1 multidrug efflux SMR transporter [Paenibacillus cellulosilyticus]